MWNALKKKKKLPHACGDYKMEIETQQSSGRDKRKKRKRKRKHGITDERGSERKLLGKSNCRKWEGRGQGVYLGSIVLIQRDCHAKYRNKKGERNMHSFVHRFTCL